MPFTLSNIKEDLEDIGRRFDGAPDLEFRAASKALELEQSALSYQRVPPGTWRGYEGGQRASRSSSSARPISARIRAKTSMVSAAGGLTSGLSGRLIVSVAAEADARHRSRDLDWASDASMFVKSRAAVRVRGGGRGCGRGSA